MKSLLRKIILHIIQAEARYVIKKFNPKIIAVTGSVGKTATKDAIYSALKDSLYIRKNQKSYNGEIGIPLTILGLQNGWSNPVLWLKNICLGFQVMFSKQYPKYLLLEAGIDRPGDMDIIGSLIQPDIIVYTAFGTTPVHVEFFDSIDAVWKEKMKLTTYLKEGGVVVYNSDDDVLASYVKKVASKTYSFGSEKADMIFSDAEYLYENQKIVGQQFTANVPYASRDVEIKNGIGVPHIYAATAALSVALRLDVSFKRAVAGVVEHVPPLGRMHILHGIKNTVILDDTYNSSPIAAQKAVETFNSINVIGKKIAIIGDMLELGEYSKSEHQKLGRYIDEQDDIHTLITVGIRARDIADAAIEKGMKSNRVIRCSNGKDAIEQIKKLLSRGDGLLFKASQGIRLERVIEPFLNDSQTATETLVRQDDEWKKKN